MRTEEELRLAAPIVRAMLDVPEDRRMDIVAIAVNAFCKTGGLRIVHYRGPGEPPCRRFEAHNWAACARSVASGCPLALADALRRDLTTALSLLRRWDKGAICHAGTGDVPDTCVRFFGERCRTCETRAFLATHPQVEREEPKR